MDRSPSYRVRFPHRLVWPATLALAGTLAAFTAKPPAEAPKTHTLFMGADLSVVSKDGALPVRDVESNSFIVSGPAGRVVVKGDDPTMKLKLDDALKLSSKYATVGQLAFDRVYSSGRDPMGKFAESARVSAYMNAGVGATDTELRWSEAAHGLANAGKAALPGDTSGEAMGAFDAQIASTAAKLSRAQADADRAQSMDHMQAFSTSGNSVKLTGDLADEQFDGLNISFEISAPRPLGDPYVVIVMRYLAQKDRPDTSLVWVHAQRLAEIDEHPRKINIRRVGFPPGYHIDSYHVHLYDKGAEVATSVSRKQVALTAAEAFDYAVIEYIGDNRDQTKAPLKAKAFWPADLTSRLVPDKLTRMLYVKVGKDGHALGLFEDENCTKPVADADIAAVVPELCFLPALQKGKPVMSIAPLKLGNLN